MDGEYVADKLTIAATDGSDFSYDLSELVEIPDDWSTADGELVISYDLKVESTSNMSGNWFIDLTTEKGSVAHWHGNQTTGKFGRFAGYDSRKTGFIAGDNATNSSSAVGNENGMVLGEYKTVTYKVNLATKNTFVGSYGDTIYTSLGTIQNLNNGKLYLNYGVGDANKNNDMVIYIKNIRAEIKTAENATKYTVSSGTVDGGSLTFSNSTPRIGETVTVTGTSSVDGGIFTTFTADNALNITKVTDTKYTFVMPANNVTVNAKMAKESIITLKNTLVNGSDEYYKGGTVAITNDLTSAAAGTEVTLTATPYYGWKLDSYTFNNDNGATMNINVDENGKFTVPDYNITITPNWTSADNMKVLCFEEGTKASDSYGASMRVQEKVYWLQSVKEKTKWNFNNVDFTNLSKITLITNGGNDGTKAKASFFKGEATTAFAEQHDMKTDREVYNPNGPTSSFYKVEFPNISGLTGTDMLRIELSNYESAGWLGNYWYIVLEYAE